MSEHLLLPFLLPVLLVSSCVLQSRASEKTECERIIPEQQPLFVDSQECVTPTRVQLKELLATQVCRLTRIYDAYEKNINNVADVAHAADAIRKTAEELGAEKRETTPWKLFAVCCVGGYLIGRYL